MSLGLDLSPSYAKAARARVHLESLKEEISRILSERETFSIRQTVDLQTGWCSLYLMNADFTKELNLGIIVGDIVHNLRSALDYVITALANASETEISQSHQFPIFTDEPAYVRAVGASTVVNRKGYLKDIIHGLQEIRDLQPFHEKVNPRLDNLALVHEFSNADKHRIIASYAPLYVDGTIELKHNGLQISEFERVAKIDAWEPDKEFYYARVRFATPVPTEIVCEADFTVSVHFITPAIGKSVGDTGIDLADLEAMCARVVEVTDIFKNL